MIETTADRCPQDITTQNAITAWVERQDELAAGWLVRHYRPMVVAIVQSRFKDPGWVEDVVQLVFIKCFRSLHRVHTGASLRPWLVRVTQNTCANAWRDQRRVIVLPATDAGIEDLDMLHAADDDSAAGNEKESRSLAAALLRQLAKQERRLVWWHYFKSRSAGETGRHLGMSAGNVRVRLCRVQKSLASRGRLLRDAAA